MDRATIISPKGGEGCEIVATLSVVNKSILVTDEGELLDAIIIRNLTNGIPIAGRIRIIAERID